MPDGPMLFPTLLLSQLRPRLFSLFFLYPPPPSPPSLQKKSALAEGKPQLNFMVPLLLPSWFYNSKGQSGNVCGNAVSEPRAFLDASFVMVEIFFSPTNISIPPCEMPVISSVAGKRELSGCLGSVWSRSAGAWFLRGLSEVTADHTSPVCAYELQLNKSKHT